MKCPSCQQQPISFARWLMMFDPVRILCNQCGAKLTLTPQWRTRYHIISIAVALLIIIPTLLSFFQVLPPIYLDNFLMGAGAFLILSLVLLSRYFWSKFEYKQDPD